MITVKTGQLNRYTIERITFPGGEEHVRLPADMVIANPVRIASIIKSSSDLIATILTVDAVRRKFQQDGVVAEVHLIIPYFPYARQDRVAVPGESLSVSAIASQINALNCATVTVVDPHSDVTGAVVNNIRIINQVQCLKQASSSRGGFQFQQLLRTGVLVAPDAGASKKIYAVSKAFGNQQVSVLDKTRDPVTGDINGMKLQSGITDFTDMDCIIIDDICDGGRTFVEAAAILKANGARRLYLYVTHGVFSKGEDALSAFDAVFTTDSFYQSSHDRVTRFDLDLDFVRAQHD